MILVGIQLQEARILEVNHVERDPHNNRVDDKENVPMVHIVPCGWKSDKEEDGIFVQIKHEMDDQEDDLGVSDWSEQKCP